MHNHQERPGPTFNATAVDLGVAAGILLFCLAVRFPFWFASVIEWDETTYTLMGQEILDGRLPYVGLWENKPPFAFVPFALALAIFPSIVSIRVAGAVALSTVAYLSYRVTNRVADRRAGILAAVMCVILVGAAPSGQSTLTEHLALAPLMGALGLLALHPLRPRTSFLTGLLLSLAVLVRTNLAYVALPVALALAVRWATSRGMYRRIEASSFAIGALLPPGCVALIYAAHGHLGTLYAATVEVPFRYATQQAGPVALFGSHLVHQPWLVSAAILALLVLCQRWWIGPPSDRPVIGFLGLFLVGGACSILMSGASHPHYLIQIIPFVVIPLAISWSLSRSSAYRLGAGLAVAAALVGSTAPVVRQYGAVVRSLQAGDPLADDRGYRVGRYLAAANPNREQIYMMTDHIGYWLTRTRPPTNVTVHPSNVAKPSIIRVVSGPQATASSEIERAFSTSPRFVVTRPGLWYLDDEPHATAVLHRRLAEDYELVTVIDGSEIYARYSRGDSPARLERVRAAR